MEEPGRLQSMGLHRVGHDWSDLAVGNTHILCKLYLNKSIFIEASLVAQLVKNPPAMRETWVPSLVWEDPLEEGMATHSSILAWRIPMDRGAWHATVHGLAKSGRWLSTNLLKKKKKTTLLPFLPPSILYVPVLWSHPCVCQHTLLFASLRRLCWAAETTDAPSSALPIDHPQRPAQMSFPPRSVMLPASRSLISALFPNHLVQLLTAPLYWFNLLGDI